MSKKVSILFLEDSLDDVELIVRKLQGRGLELIYDRVDSGPQMRERLGRNSYDIILSDYSMPGFSVKEALDILKAMELDTPFIIVSGVIGEEAAVEIMKQGATDYLLKDSLNRLAPAIEKAVSDAREMRSAKEKAAELAELRELYASIVESSEDAIIGCSLDGLITSWNMGAEKIFGYTGEEALGKPLSILSGEGMPNEFPLILNQVKNGESFRNYETVRSNRKGEIVFLSIVVSPVRSDDSAVSGASVIARDISELKKTEKKLQASENLYRFVFEESVLPIVFAGPDGEIRLANREFERLSGYKKEKIEGQLNCADFIDRDFFTGLFNVCETDCGPASENQSETSFVSMDGTVKRVMASAEKTGTHGEAVIFFNDITQYINRLRGVENLLKLERAELCDCRSLRLCALEDVSRIIDGECTGAEGTRKINIMLEENICDIRRGITLEEILSDSDMAFAARLSAIAEFYNDSGDGEIELICSSSLQLMDRLLEENLCRIICDRISEAVEYGADRIKIEAQADEGRTEIVVSDDGGQRLAVKKRKFRDMIEERASVIDASVSEGYAGGYNRMVLLIKNSVSLGTQPAVSGEGFRKQKTRVAILAKEQIARAGLSGIINSKKFTVSGEFEAVNNLVRFAENNYIDVIAAVLSVEKGIDLETVKALTQRFPSIPVLVLSTENDRHYAPYILRSGGRGVVLANESAEEILKALSIVAEGDLYFHNSPVKKGKSLSVQEKIHRPIGDILSPREMEIFVLLGRGEGPAEISRKMNLSVKTIETYRRRIREKLGIDKASELLKYAISWVHNSD